MMGHELQRSGSFWSFLLSIDRDLADSADYGLEHSVDQDDVMVDDQLQSMHRHRF